VIDTGGILKEMKKTAQRKFTEEVGSIWSYFQKGRRETCGKAQGNRKLKKGDRKKKEGW